MSNKRSLAQLSVWLGQTLVGSITELPNDRNLFVFDESYADNPDRPVLSLSFYDAEGRLDGVPGEFCTSCNDRNWNKRSWTWPEGRSMELSRW